MNKRLHACKIHCVCLPTCQYDILCQTEKSETFLQFIDGLNGRVTLPNLLHFPKYERPGEDINIIHEVAGSRITKEFGTNLLQDDEGTIMGLLFEKHSDPVKILTEVFEMWIQGKAGLSPRNWQSLVRYLQGEKLTVLAENIEHYLAPPDTAATFEGR